VEGIMGRQFGTKTRFVRIAQNRRLLHLILWVSIILMAIKEASIEEMGPVNF